MEAALQGIVEGIHASGRRCVLAITGGGSGAIAALLRVPGGSRVLLEAIVPYERGALVELLGREPEQACSAETAVAMARRALARGRRRCDEPRLVGVGVTASLVSDRPKEGDHRCHIAVADAERIDVVSIVLEKGRRDRGAEEDLVARAVLLTLARACDVAGPDVKTLLGPGDRLTVASVSPEKTLGDPIDRLLYPFAADLKHPIFRIFVEMQPLHRFLFHQSSVGSMAVLCLCSSKVLHPRSLIT